MTMKAAIKIAIADRNHLFRECLVEFLTLKGYQVVQQYSGKSDLLLQNNGLVPDVCLVQLTADETGIAPFINDLKNINPAIKILLYSLEVSLKGFKAPLFGADAMLAETTSLAGLEKVLKSITKKNLAVSLP